jgi:hypothetical protein
MSKSHTWFGTQADAELIITWLRDAGARQLDGRALAGEWVPDGRELAIHFPSIGPIVFWPDQIPVPECGDISRTAKRAILAMIAQKENAGRPEIDVDRSAVAGLRLPELRDGRYWVAGHIWFPTSRLNEVFPDLNRVCGRLERLLKKQPVVFDSTRGENKSVFDHQICSSGVLHRIVALPEAFALLNKGEYVVDYLASPKQYSEFRRKLQPNGDCPGRLRRSP